MTNGQYNGLADLLLAASRAFDLGGDNHTENSMEGVVPTYRIAPTKRWFTDDSSSGSESDSMTPVPRKRTEARARHPYQRAKSEGKKADYPLKKGKGVKGTAQHNEVEKRRRAYLSSCYVNLKNLVPKIANVKASNVTILQTAAAHAQELDAIAERLTEQLQAAKRRREKLQAEIASIRARKQSGVKSVGAATVAVAAKWFPPQVGYSSGYDSSASAGSYENDTDIDESSAVVPDAFATDIDSDRMTPSFSMLSTPFGTDNGKGKAEPLSAPNGNDLLMLLAASATVGSSPSCSAVEAKGTTGGRRQARRPARFL